jgi:ribosomal protein S18 acetylase RimI-like enzyme
MTIRKATATDLPQLAALFDAYRVFYEKESDLISARNFLAARIDNHESEIFVAESGDGILAGFVQLYPVFSSTRMKRAWLLNDLFVSPTFRGQQISIYLIDAAKKLAIETKAAGLTLETSKSNTTGNKLYPKAGFELDEAHNFYSWDVMS